MRIRRLFALLVLASVVLAAASCSTQQSAESVTSAVQTTETSASSEDTTMSEQTKATTEKTTSTETSATSEMTIQTEETTTVTEAERSMTLKIGEKEVQVTWEDNDSVEDLKKLAASDLTIKMSMYGGFEQVGSIGQAITRDDKQTTTKPGDIVLYSGDQIVMFYGSNSWSYTRLGKINLTEKELKDLVGNGDVTITLSLN